MRKKDIVCRFGGKFARMLALFMLVGCMTACDKAVPESVNTGDVQAITETESAADTQEADSSKTAETEELTSESVEQSKAAEEEVKDENALAQGVYSVKFTTDNSMFHVSEACEGRGTLTVDADGMMLHISLASKNIVNLYPGLAVDAEKEDAKLLQPTIDTVTYSDGLSEEVNGFDVPVPYLDKEFDLALLGTKGKWYDHKVSVSDAQPLQDKAKNSGSENAQAEGKTEKAGNPEEGAESKSEKDAEDVMTIADGKYQVSVTLTGGTGKATVESPATLWVKDGKMQVELTWSSKNYDYMMVNGEKYLNEAKEGENSFFTIPVSALNQDLSVIADTVAMSTPHEIEYTLRVELAGEN